MECRDAQFYMRMRRHGGADELGPDVTAPLEQHLAGCEACAAEAHDLESFDRALGAAMVAAPVPAGLRAKLIGHVARRQGTALRRRALRGAVALAASVLFAGLAVGVFSRTRPSADADRIVELADEQLEKPAQSTQSWLAAQKLPTELPLPFDYNLLAFRGYENVSGQHVPVLVFRSPDPAGDPTAFAKVYLFKHDGLFDLKHLQDAQASLTRAKVYVGQANWRGATYVFVHSGRNDRDLQRFFVGGAGS
ncbi:MAG: hypothetical protein ACKODX_01435 [Gemmata sp.]